MRTCVCVLQVRTTRLGVMGLAMNRFANLPFQSWELKPGGPGAVQLTLIAAVVVADFTIRVSIINHPPFSSTLPTFAFNPHKRSTVHQHFSVRQVVDPYSKVILVGTLHLLRMLFITFPFEPAHLTVVKCLSRCLGVMQLLWVVVLGKVVVSN